jgi:hypothetical protein
VTRHQQPHLPRGDLELQTGSWTAWTTLIGDSIEAIAIRAENLEGLATTEIWATLIRQQLFFRSHAGHLQGSNPSVVQQRGNDRADGFL